jgi:cobaltochelatase CobT
LHYSPHPERSMGVDAQESVQAQVRRQQRLDALCAATLRALSARPDVQRRASHWFADTQQLPSFAPHLHPHMQLPGAPPGPVPTAALQTIAHAVKVPRTEHLALRDQRGAADGTALRLRFSDAQLHRLLRPALPMARRVFDVLEQYRVEALVPETWPGVRRNVRERFSAWSQAFVTARLHESAQGLLLLTVAQVGRARVTGEPMDEALQDMLEATRFGLAPHIGHALAALRRSRHDQRAYAEHALAIAAAVAALAERAKTQVAGDEKDLPEQDSEENAWLQIWVDFEAGEEQGIASALEARESVQSVGTDYRVFSTRYDRQVQAATLARPAQLQELRAYLDRGVQGSGINMGQLARRLQALLARPQTDGFDSGQDTGTIDGRRLAQLVAKPSEHRIFRLAHQAPHTDVAVTLLLDCSGSMKQHMDKLAPLLDVLTRALEMAGVATELLGYTTGAWNGGRVMRDWRRAGKPSQPGRLNELCHIVFKDSDTPWRRSKQSIAALLKADLFRECVDGEALRWAATRLQAQEVERRILLVFSDGSPMDGATVMANSSHYLDVDLQHCAGQIERAGQIALCGVGLGLDLSAFFTRNRVLDLHQQSVSQALGDILGLLAP